MTDYVYKDAPIPQRRPDRERSHDEQGSEGHVQSGGLSRDRVIRRPLLLQQGHSASGTRGKSPDELFGPGSGIYRGMPPGADKSSRIKQRSELEFEAGLNRVQPDRGTVTGTAVPGPGTPWKSRARVFYEQAQEYAGRESAARFEGVFRRYYPTYADLPEQVLEGYFGWRTRARKKEWEKAPFAFIYLYIYEIFTQAGISSPEEGYRILKEIDGHYGLERPGTSQSFLGGTESMMLHVHLIEWMRDYCAYFNLSDPWHGECFEKWIDNDRYLSILRRTDSIAAGVAAAPGNTDADSAESQPASITAQAAAYTSGGEHVSREEFFGALEAVSSFSPRSKMYQKHPEECMDLLVRICRALSGYFKNTARRTLYEYCFGQQEREVHRMFENAVFWDFKNYSDYCYQIDDIRFYICRNGSWQLEGPAGSSTARSGAKGSSSRPAHKSGLLGDFLQEAERQMREAYGVKPALKQKTYNENIVAVIGDAIRSYQKEQDEARKPRITIDFSRLSAIRSDADITAGRLLEGSEEESGAAAPIRAISPAEETAVTPIEENPVDQLTARRSKEDSVLVSASISEDNVETAERAEVNVLLGAYPSVGDEVAIPVQEGTSDSPLTAEESHFLRLVLDGGDYVGYARSIHAFPSVMADGINEKLYDYLNDTALEDDGSGQLTVVEDYTEDVRDLLGENG